MDLSNLPTSLVSQLTGAVEGFIVASRKKYGANAVPLTPAQKRAMQPFFSREILDQVKVVALNGSRVEDPPFYAMAKMMGIRNLLSFSEVAAVTFVDIVVSHEPFSDTLLFHELVHVVQYAQMGSKEFASRYVRGFLKSGSYDEFRWRRTHTNWSSASIARARRFRWLMKYGSGWKREDFSFR